jgi:hypothetical protein
MEINLEKSDTMKEKKNTELILTKEVIDECLQLI